MRTAWDEHVAPALLEVSGRDTAANASRTLPILLALGEVPETVVVSSSWHLRVPYFFAPYGRFGLDVRYRASVRARELAPACWARSSAGGTDTRPPARGDGRHGPAAPARGAVSRRGAGERGARACAPPRCGGLRVGHGSRHGCVRASQGRGWTAMFAVRIHGRGGQGVVTTAELLSLAAFLEGRHAQAFPSFGSERTGAPVVAFCRIDDRRDPRPRADLRSGRADRPGPHAAAPGGRVRRARARRSACCSTPAAPPGSSAWARSASRRSSDDGPGDRAGQGAPGPPAPGPGAARRLRGAHRRDLARLRGGRDARPLHRRHRGRQRRGRARGARIRGAPAGAGPCLGRSKARGPWRETVAACRPEVICAYPISPQTHIVEGLSRSCKAGEPRPLRVHQRRVASSRAMSACIGASATGARTYTATASQGLLFMAEALYNASGLGLPIVMTVANRAIGAPINIWNDHSDSMSQRDSGWIQLYAETNQEAARPARAGVPARRGALAAGDGLHGRLHPHARLRAGRRPGRRSRSTPSCRRSSRARCSTPTSR